MRFIRALCLSAAAIVFCAQAAAQKIEAGDADIARPGGVYALLTAESPDACAALCTEDGICLAWTYMHGACELKAVAPSPIRSIGARSGLSARTPPALRQADAVILGQITPLAAPAAAASQPSPSPLVHVSADNNDLLGGVGDDDAPGGLRPRLGSAGT